MQLQASIPPTTLWTFVKPIPTNIEHLHGAGNQPVGDPRSGGLNHEVGTLFHRPSVSCGCGQVGMVEERTRP